MVRKKKKKDNKEIKIAIYLINASFLYAISLEPINLDPKKVILLS
jgi:hypothetical protein